MNNAFPLVRNVAGLHGQRFDLLVIGGGIYGAWTAFDASLRGLSVALIEKDDWGAGTSSASSKLIHGGLRYLEHYDFALVKHALTERRVLSTIAPHLVRPLRFVVPVHQGARVGMFMMGAGLTLYDFLSGFNQPVARHQRFNTEKLAKRHPYLLHDGLKGGFSYGDCQEDDARMTLHVVAAAQSAGAVCANRLAAVALEEGAEGRVTHARVRDTETGEEFTVEAEGYIATAGPWSRQLLGDRAPKMKLVKGVHLVLPAIPGSDEAFLLTAPQDGRVFFVIPWYGRTLVGTTEAEILDPREAVVKPEEQRYLLDAVNALMPGLKWTDADVIAGFAGARTLQAEETASLAAVTREFELLLPRPNLLLPLGGKYTTARSDSVEIVDRALQMLGRTAVESATDRHALPGTPTVNFDAWYEDARARLGAQGIDPEAAQWLALRHGTGIERIIDWVRAEPALAERLHPQAPFLVAEAKQAVQDEMARSVEDVLRRRMPMRLLVGAERLAREGVEARVEALLREAG
jgi:glycerol-3-phosphate dehydrogenase